MSERISHDIEARYQRLVNAVTGAKHLTPSSRLLAVRQLESMIQNELTSITQDWITKYGLPEEVLVLVLQRKPISAIKHLRKCFAVNIGMEDYSIRAQLTLRDAKSIIDEYRTKYTEWTSSVVTEELGDAMENFARTDDLPPALAKELMSVAFAVKTHGRKHSI